MKVLFPQEPAAFDLRAVGKPELPQRRVVGQPHCFFGGICRQDALGVDPVDGLRLDKPAAQEIEQRSPVFFAHQNERKVLNLVGLDKCRRLEDFVQSAETTRQGNEGVGVFHKHQLAHEEVSEGYPTIKVPVGFLFLRQLDVASDGVASYVFGVAVSGLHDAWSTAGHHREAGASQPLADFVCQDVKLMLGSESRRAEHRQTLAEEMELAEAAHDLEENANCPSQFETALLRSLENLRDLRNGWRLVHVGRRRCRPSLRLPGEVVGVEKVNPSNPFYRRALAGGDYHHDKHDAPGPEDTREKREGGEDEQ
jgi:hypothetical protein